MKGILIFVILLFPLLLNAGETYRWVDDRGVIHFTDDPGTVPEDYRGEAESRMMTEEIPTPLLDEAEYEEDEGILVEDDLLEKDEEWWRTRAEKWKTRRQAAYEDYEKVRLRYNDLATEFNASKDPDQRKKLKAELDQMQAEMKKRMADIKEAQKMTDEVLPSQAKEAGKPVEWVR